MLIVEFQRISTYGFMLTTLFVLSFVACSRKKRIQQTQTTESLLKAPGMQRQLVVTDKVKKEIRRKNKVEHTTRLSVRGQDISESAYMPTTKTEIPTAVPNVMVKTANPNDTKIPRQELNVQRTQKESEKKTQKRLCAKDEQELKLQSTQSESKEPEVNLQSTQEETIAITLCGKSLKNTERETKQNQSQVGLTQCEESQLDKTQRSEIKPAKKTIRNKNKNSYLLAKPAIESTKLSPNAN